MKIKDIAFHDRPSERLIKYGAGVLSDYELLAIVLGKVKDASILEFCSKLLEKYNLHKMYDIGFEVLKKGYVLKNCLKLLYTTHTYLQVLYH